jgi:hypothetical protein
MTLIGSIGRDADAFEKAAKEVRLSPETKDLFRREFSPEELLLMSGYLKEAEKEYSRKKFLAHIALVLFAAVVTYLLVSFGWDYNTRSFRVSPWFVVFLPLIIALIILPISYILRKRKTNESMVPLTGERKLRHWAKTAIETEDIKRSNNITRNLRIFKK